MELNKISELALRDEQNIESIFEISCLDLRFLKIYNTEAWLYYEERLLLGNLLNS